MIVGSALWVLIRQSDAVTWIILFILLLMSIVSWTIAVQKWLMLRRKLHEAQKALDGVTANATVGALHIASLQHAQQPAGTIALRAEKAAQVHKHTRMTYDDVMLLRDEMDGSIQEAVIAVEEHTVLLRIIAEAGPLLGLLGTIWGLIHSFVRISHERSSDIATVAPGIAEALITTMMGLLVAIPALLFFHAVARYIYAYEARLTAVAEQCERIVRDAGVETIVRTVAGEHNVTHTP